MTLMGLITIKYFNRLTALICIHKYGPNNKDKYIRFKITSHVDHLPFMFTTINDLPLPLKGPNLLTN